MKENDGQYNSVAVFFNIYGKFCIKLVCHPNCEDIVSKGILMLKFYLALEVIVRYFHLAPS